MYRIPNQFDPRAQATLSAAGGGSTSTTCSSCVVTLAAVVVVPAVLFSKLAAAQPAAPEDVAARPRMSKLQAVMWALVVPLCAWTLPGGLLLMLGGDAGGGIVLLGMVALGAWIGVFGHVYQRTQGRRGKGIGIAVSLLIGFVVMAAIEMSIWLS